MARQAHAAMDSDSAMEFATDTGRYEWSADDDRLVWSAGLLRIFGLDDVPVGEAGFTRLVHPDDRLRVEAETAAMLGSRSDRFRHAFRILRPDGAIRFILDRGVIERDGQGRARVVRGMNLDVTDLHRPDAAAADSQSSVEQRAEIEALYAQAPLGLAMLDRDLRFVRINEALAAINGIAAADHIGRHVWDLLPDLRMSAEPALHRVLETGEPLRNVAITGETAASPGLQRAWREHFYPVCGATGLVEGIGIICEEVTDTIAQDRARADSEARLAAALKAGNLGVHELDPRTGAMVWDATVRAIWGIAADAAITYQTFIDGLHPEDYPAVQAAVAAAFDPSGDGRYGATYRVINRQTGEVRWIRADGDVTFDGDTATRLVGTVKDITDRKQAEAVLAESEARFRNMADNAPVMVWVTNHDGACTYLNADWYQFTGQTEEEALGFGWLRAVHPEDAARSEQVFRDATERKAPFRLNYRLRRADGVYRWAVDSARPRLGSDGSFLGFIGSVMDITDLKDVEEQLRAAHDTSKQLVERSPFGIFAVDSDFRLVQVSDGAKKVFANVRPLLGRDFAEALRAIWPEPFASETIAHYRHTLATGETYHAPGTVERRADSGETEAYDWKIEQITMPDGRPGVVCHFYDLSERQAFEEKIQYLMREINHRAKNLLALVNAIARQTASTSPEDFLERFSQRLGALAANQQLLLRSEWDGADLRALVESQLQPFKDLVGRRILLDGPAVNITPAAAQTIGMALHELATNAAKYGALSTGAGRVAVSWHLAERDGQPLFTMTWTEQGGPPVVAPAHTGFGERVAKRMVESALSGEVALDYAETGLVWRLQCQLDQVAGAAPH